MFKLSLKNIWSRKGRMVLTALAVIAGTAFLSGVFVFTDTINGCFNRMFADAFKGTDGYVRSANVVEGDFGAETRDRIDLAVVDIVAAVPGVREAHGDVFGFATVAFEGKVLGQDGPPSSGRLDCLKARHGACYEPWPVGPSGRVGSRPRRLRRWWATS